MSKFKIEVVVLDEDIDAEGLVFSVKEKEEVWAKPLYELLKQKFPKEEDYRVYVYVKRGIGKYMKTDMFDRG